MNVLMTKLFSDETPEEFKQKVAAKVDEAKEKGTSELVDDSENLQFADVDGDVVITDVVNKEMTKAVDNPDDPTDSKLVEMAYPQDPVDAPDSQITVTKEDGGTYSVCCKGMSKEEAAEFCSLCSTPRKFSDEEATPEEMPAGEELAHDVNEVEKAVVDAVAHNDKDLADATREIISKLESKCDECENRGDDCSVVREELASFSKKLDSVGRTRNFSAVIKRRRTRKFSKTFSDVEEKVEDLIKDPSVDKAVRTKESVDAAREEAKELCESGIDVAEADDQLRGYSALCDKYSKMFGEEGDPEPEETPAEPEEPVDEPAGDPEPEGDPEDAEPANEPTPEEPEDAEPVDEPAPEDEPKEAEPTQEELEAKVDEVAEKVDEIEKAVDETHEESNKSFSKVLNSNFGSAAVNPINAPKDEPRMFSKGIQKPKTSNPYLFTTID